MSKLSKLMVGIVLLGAIETGIAAEIPARPNLINETVAGFDLAQVAATADFAHYKFVWVQTPEVTLEPDWVREHAHDMTPEDQQKMAATYGEALQKILIKQLTTNANYALGASLDAQTLVIKPQLMDLVVTAPELSAAGRTDVYVRQVGRARLTLDLVDGVSGAVIAHLEVAGETRDRAGEELVKADRARNRLDFRQLMRHWARDLQAFMQQKH